MGSQVFSKQLDTAVVDPALQGRWRVVKIRNPLTGQATQVTDNEPKMEIQFSKGYARLQAGGVGISGEVQAIDGSYHVVRYMTTTTLPSEGNAKAQESRLYRAFSDKGFYQISEDGLDILGGDKSLSISLVRAE